MRTCANTLRACSKERWNVVSVADGNLALEAALNQNVSLIVSDIMMPGMDGFELLAALKQPRTNRICACHPAVRSGRRGGKAGRAEGRS